jgi:hypothetical protein
LASSKNYTIRPKTEGLKKLRARLLYCAHSAHQMGIKGTLPFFKGSSTYNLSKLMLECQNVLVAVLKIQPHEAVLKIYHSP